MQLKLLLQPYAEEQRIGAALGEQSQDATGLWVLSAWAQRSGIDHLEPLLASIRSRGGKTEAVLGVDQGIATIEGLQAALELFDDVYLFHDGRRAFHPKVYVVDSPRRTRVIIGSGNLTEGGLFRNYEAATVIDLGLRSSDDKAKRQDLRDYFESFIRSPAPCKRLDAQLVANLSKAGAIVSISEKTRADRQKQRRAESALRRIFGRGVEGLPSPPPVRRDGRRRPTRSSLLPSKPGPRVPSSRKQALRVTASWWKRLTPSDAMHKPAQSHQRNYVILGQAGHPISQATFFRDHLFAGATWAQQPMRTGRVKELAVVPFDVNVDGRSLGKLSFSIDHNAERIANQGNSPTWLNWSGFATYVRRRNLTGWYLLLERLTDGTFRMSITRQPPGPAIIPRRARRA